MLWELFITFFKIGLFTFGGGYAMIPLISQEVLSHGWLDEDMLSYMIGISESTPGPIAINMATFIGSSQAGILGATLATLGVVLPSFLIILLIAAIFKKILNNKHVKGTLDGIKPVIVALILVSGISFVSKAIFGAFAINGTYAFDYKALIIVAILVIIMLIYKLVRRKSFPAIALIVISAILGMALYAF